MKARKPKANEPSLRDRLSAKFIKDFEADFQEHGTDVIQQLREKHPDKYAVIATQLIASADPLGSVFSEAKSMRDIGLGLLAQVGCNNPTEEQIQSAIQANDELVARLESIRDNDELASLEMAAALDASGIRQ